MAATTGPSNGQPFADAAVIDFLHEFKDSYVRTRHNNLRCFPSCGRVHRESSFCGRSVEIKILKALVPNLKESFVFGEFRRQNGPSGFSIRESYAKARLKSDANNIELAEYVNMNEHYYRFVFTPNKKWRYDARIPRQQDVHVFTVYLVNSEVISHILDSKGFVIVPVWKTEEFLLKAHSEDLEAGNADDEDSPEGDDETTPTKPRKQPILDEPPALSKSTSPPKRAVDEPSRNETKKIRVASPDFVAPLLPSVLDHNFNQTVRPLPLSLGTAQRPNTIQGEQPLRSMPLSRPLSGFAQQNLQQNFATVDSRHIMAGLFNPASARTNVFMPLGSYAPLSRVMYSHQQSFPALVPQSLQAQPMIMGLPPMLQGASPFVPSMNMPPYSQAFLPPTNGTTPSLAHVQQAQSSQRLPGPSKQKPARGRPN